MDMIVRIAFLTYTKSLKGNPTSVRIKKHHTDHETGEACASDDESRTKDDEPTKLNANEPTDVNIYLNQLIYNSLKPLHQESPIIETRKFIHSDKAISMSFGRRVKELKWIYLHYVNFEDEFNFKSIMKMMKMNVEDGN